MTPPASSPGPGPLSGPTRSTVLEVGHFHHYVGHFHTYRWVNMSRRWVTFALGVGVRVARTKPLPSHVPSHFTKPTTSRRLASSAVLFGSTSWTVVREVPVTNLSSSPRKRSPRQLSHPCEGADRG